jgi:hypothetical protein
LVYRYDSDADIFQFELGGRSAAYSYPAADGIYVKIDPWTDELVGGTIFGFSKTDLRLLKECFPMVEWSSLAEPVDFLSGETVTALEYEFGYD